MRPSVPGREPKLWVFAREPKPPFLTSVANVAVESNLYSPQDASGRRSSEVERRLCELESVLRVIWPQIAWDCVPLERTAVRKALALFVATLYLRNPQRIENCRALHERVVNEFDKLPKDHLGRPAISHVIRDGTTLEFDPAGWETFTAWRESDHRLLFSSMIFREARRIAERLLTKRWTIVACDDPVFVTGDVPVCLFNVERERYGFGTAGTQIGLPLSPVRFLLLGDPGLPEGYYAIQPGFAEAMNYLIWTNADRYLLSSQPSDEALAGIMSFADAFGLG